MAALIPPSMRDEVERFSTYKTSRLWSAAVFNVLRQILRARKPYLHSTISRDTRQKVLNDDTVTDKVDEKVEKLHLHPAFAAESVVMYWTCFKRRYGVASVYSSNIYMSSKH